MASVGVAVGGPLAVCWPTVYSLRLQPRTPQTRTPRLTIRCEYPDTLRPTKDVTFHLSPSFGIHTARDPHAWFLDMLREHEEFEVSTDRAGEAPMPFRSETVRQVVVE